MPRTTATAMPPPPGDDDAVHPREARPRQNIRATIDALFGEDPEAIIARCHDGRGAERAGDRHGHRTRQTLGTFGTETVPRPFRARLASGRIQMRKVDGRKTLDQTAARDFPPQGPKLLT